MPLRNAFYVINIGYIIFTRNLLSDFGIPLDPLLVPSAKPRQRWAIASEIDFDNVGTPKVAPFSTPTNQMAA